MKKKILISMAILALSPIPMTKAEELVEENETIEEPIIIEENSITNNLELFLEEQEGKYILILDNESLTRDIEIKNSSLEIILQNNAIYQGKIISEESEVIITLDESSKLILESDLYLSTLNNPLEDNTNIEKNEYNIYINGETQDIEEEEIEKIENIPTEVEELETNTETEEKNEVEEKKSSNKKTTSKTKKTTQNSNNKQNNKEQKNTSKKKETENKNSNNKKEEKSNEKIGEKETKKEKKNTEESETKKEKKTIEEQQETEEKELGFLDKIIKTIQKWFYKIWS